MKISSEDLRTMVCAQCGNKDPKCEGIVLNSRCHTGAGTFVTYLQGEHALEVSCAECFRHIVKIQLPTLQ